MHCDYRTKTFQQFRDEQLDGTSRHDLLAQVDRAEQLLADLDPQRSYTPRQILGQINDHYSQPLPNNRVSGEDFKHDLRLFIEDISDAADIPAEAVGERVMTVDELSKLFHVSTKTISRWRQQGLVGRKFVMDGRKRMGFLQSSVERFVAGNQERIQRGSRFRHMTDDERSRIVESARRLSVRASLRTQKGHLSRVNADSDRCRGWARCTVPLCRGDRLDDSQTLDSWRGRGANA